MKSAFIVTTLFTITATASIFSTASTFDTAVIKASPTHHPQLCTFNPNKGEYECPAVTQWTAKDGSIEANKMTVAQDTAAVAADCNKCQHDWSECMKVSPCVMRDQVVWK